MIYRQLINGQLSLSELGMGCASYWGNRLFSTRQAHKVVHRAIDGGINYFDTGHSYSGGLAEQRLGQALKGRHEGLNISSKAGTRNGHFGRLYKDFSPEWIRQSCESSLRHLKVDHLPLFFLHGPNPEDFNDSTYQVLDELRQAGKIRLAGVNTFNDHIIQLTAECQQFQCVMLDYNILTQQRATTMAALHTAGMDVLVAGALAGGLYDRRFKQFKGIKSLWYWLRAWKNNRSLWQQAQQFDFLNGHDEYTATQLALAFALGNPHFASALIGTTSIAHLDELLAAVELELPESLLTRIQATSTPR